MYHHAVSVSITAVYIIIAWIFLLVFIGFSVYALIDAPLFLNRSYIWIVISQQIELIKNWDCSLINCHSCEAYRTKKAKLIPTVSGMLTCRMLCMTESQRKSNILVVYYRPEVVLFFFIKVLTPLDSIKQRPISFCLSECALVSANHVSVSSCSHTLVLSPALLLYKMWHP